MSYKDTLNLPKTNFPMKANLSCLEPQILKKWEDSDLYKNRILKKNTENSFVLHDGPPYANGDIHIGHALNKCLKDFIIKYMAMKGQKSVYVPGWDCHGLPVEHALFKKIKKTKHDVDILEFRKQARDYALNYVKIQAEEFRRLGVFGLWDDPYLTLNPEYESAALNVLADLVEKGYIYRGLKPVNWCSVCETALAEAEVEYEQKESPAIYIKFPFQKSENDLFLLVWTTTPWTLMGNVACAVHPDLNYVKVKVNENGKDTYYILAESLFENVFEKKAVAYSIVENYKGKDLEKKIVMHPFLDRQSVIILADYVSGEEGTGAVHIAPGHGEEDYREGKKNNLPMYVPVNDKGLFADEYKNLNDCAEEDLVFSVPEWLSGCHVFKANRIIIDKLESLDKLFLSENITHSYPKCWRCKSPIIFRATKQWFMNTDYEGLKNKIISCSNQVKWFPERGKKRFTEMIKNRPDWCLSRQRLWGVPVPSFICEDCKEDIIDAELTREISDMVKKEGSGVWFRKQTSEFLPEDFSCPKCGSSNIKKGMDILDVWFESGVSHKAVLSRPYLSYPADLYLEGSDQHRGWFQTSMITAVSSAGTAPFKDVLTHGFVVDAEGKKMSKSKGNVISAIDVLQKYGADILRLWVFSCDYTTDIKISNQILSNISDSYRKIRNTVKFMMGNLYDFNLKKQVKYEELMDIDKWILADLAKLIKSFDENFKTYNFHKIYRDINKFCVVKLSSFYLDILKDRLYVYRQDSLQRRSAQTSIYFVLTVLIKILAPVMPFTCEQAWEHMPEELKKSHSDSIHLENFPEIKEEWIDELLTEKWEKMMFIRDTVLKELEIVREKGVIGSSLEAEVILHTKSEKLFDFLKEFENLQYIFIVSQTGIKKDGSLSSAESYSLEDMMFQVSVKKAQGDKCLRCWNFSKSVGQNEKYPDLCFRCLKQID